MSIICVDHFQTDGGKCWADSRDIAETFGKRHRDLLRKIKTLDCTLDFNQRNFALVKYTDKKGQQRTAYKITKDGFFFLAMSFTGNYKFKELYIDVFNKAVHAPVVASPIVNVPLNQLEVIVSHSVNKAVSAALDSLEPIVAKLDSPKPVDPIEQKKKNIKKRIDAYIKKHTFITYKQIYTAVYDNIEFDNGTDKILFQIARKDGAETNLNWLVENGHYDRLSNSLAHFENVRRKK